MNIKEYRLFRRISFYFTQWNRWYFFTSGNTNRSERKATNFPRRTYIAQVGTKLKYSKQCTWLFPFKRLNFFLITINDNLFTLIVNRFMVRMWRLALLKSVVNLALRLSSERHFNNFILFGDTATLQSSASAMALNTLSFPIL